MSLRKVHLQETVLEAARARIVNVFDRFEHVHASVSGGKDSLVLFFLALAEARRRGRPLHVFFLDQEAEYAATIDVIRWMMSQPGVVPLWYQVPLYLTNATSYLVDQLYAWGPGEPWMREKEPGAIGAIEGKYPQRFYPFFEWWEREQPAGSAFLVGLRAEEGVTRFRAVTKHPGLPDLPWSSKTKRAGSVKLYPLYDWGMGDVWKLIRDEALPYNRVYDALYALGHGVYNTMRVSNLIHEIAFRSLAELALIEPGTYARLERRLPGVHAAAQHARSAFLYDARELPAAFPTWRAFRDHLLETMPIDETKKARHRRRFAGQNETEAVFQAQCKRLLIGDHEGNVPITTRGASKKRPVEDRFARWRRLW